MRRIYPYLFVWIWIRMFTKMAAQRLDIVDVLRNDRIPSGDIKVSAEFELSFFTMPLGFVDDEYTQYRTPWEYFMRTYLDFISGSEAHETRITNTYFQEKEYKICRAYLNDPILKENRFKLEDPTEGNPCRYELKSVKFHYFSRITEFVKVIGCPVSVERKVSRLYFHEFHYNKWLISEKLRGYFVFANINVDNEHGPQHLEILMYTSSKPRQLPRIDEDPESEEAEYRDSRYRRKRNSHTFKLYVDFKFWEDKDYTNLHLFGEEAEVFFLSSIYGFFKHNDPYWKKKIMVATLNRMGKGYELNKVKMEIITKQDTKTTCINFIKNNATFLEYGITIDENLPHHETEWTTKIVLFPLTQILDGREHKLLKCPVIYREYEYLYILPVYYRGTHKQTKVFSFVVNKERSDLAIPWIYSSVDTTQFDIPDLIDFTGPFPDGW